MNSTITITPVTNIKNQRVVDESKIEKRTYDYDMDVLTFYTQAINKTWRGNLVHVSLSDDVQYKILQMLSK